MASSFGGNCARDGGERLAQPIGQPLLFRGQEGGQHRGLVLGELLHIVPIQRPHIEPSGFDEGLALCQVRADVPPGLAGPHMIGVAVGKYGDWARGVTRGAQGPEDEIGAAGNRHPLRAAQQHLGFDAPLACLGGEQPCLFPVEEGGLHPIARLLLRMGRQRVDQALFQLTLDDADQVGVRQRSRGLEIGPAIQDLLEQLEPKRLEMALWWLPR